MTALRAYEVDQAIERPDPARRLILLYGPDSGLVSERADRLAEKSGVDPGDPFSTIRLNADDLADDRARLVDEALTVGMFGGERLIRVSGTTRKNLAGAVKSVLDKPLREVWIIVEAGELAPSSPLRQTVERSPHALALPCYPDGDRELDRLIAEEISGVGFSIEAETVDFLRPLLGGDRLASRNELKKLALYASGEAQITIQHVRQIVGDASAFDVDDVIDAVIGGDLAGLEENLGRLVESGVAPDMLLIFTLRFYQRLHEMRGRLESGGANAKSLVSATKPPIHFTRRPGVAAALARLPLTAIERALQRLKNAAFEARAHPELGEAIAGTCLLALTLEARAANARGN